MLIDKINLNYLRIFECVYKHRSMTKAAEELFLTQSGISQHMKQLEELLEVQLFDRVKHRLIPTSQAKELYERVSSNLLDIETALGTITSKQNELYGHISLGVPIEFGNSVVLPIAGQFAKENPKVNFRFTYGFASEMEQLLLDGSLDMAVVDEYQMDPSIDQQKVYTETLHLCVGLKYLKDHNLKASAEKKFFETLDYIKYSDKESLLQKWFKHHHKFHSIKLNIRSTLMDVEGVARLVSENLGAGILPNHMIEKLESRKEKIRILPGKKKTLENPISLAKITRRTQSPAAESFYQFLQKELKTGQ